MLALPAPGEARALPRAAAAVQGGAMVESQTVQQPSIRHTLATAAIQAAVDQARAAQPRITRDVAIYLAEGGAHVTDVMMEQSEVVHEVLNLVVMLPAHALANICGLTTEAVHATPAQSIIKHALRKAQHRWVPPTADAGSEGGGDEGPEATVAGEHMPIILLTGHDWPGTMIADGHWPMDDCMETPPRSRYLAPSAWRDAHRRALASMLLKHVNKGEAGAAFADSGNPLLLNRLPP